MCLFQEPPDGLDENWNLGALVGGMASPMNNFDMARFFRVCAENLMSLVPRELEAYEIIYPALFLYRHTIELYLKAIVPKFKFNHDLNALKENLANLVEKGFDMKLPGKAKRIIQEFHDYDPKSTKFRYGDGFIAGEFWVEISKLKCDLEWLFNGFENIYKGMRHEPL